jgi:hypothetical protein
MIRRPGLMTGLGKGMKHAQRERLASAPPESSSLCDGCSAGWWLYSTRCRKLCPRCYNGAACQLLGQCDNVLLSVLTHVSCLV